MTIDPIIAKDIEEEWISGNWYTTGQIANKVGLSKTAILNYRSVGRFRPGVEQVEVNRIRLRMKFKGNTYAAKGKWIISFLKALNSEAA